MNANDFDPGAKLMFSTDIDEVKQFLESSLNLKLSGGQRWVAYARYQATVLQTTDNKLFVTSAPVAGAPKFLYFGLACVTQISSINAGEAFGYSPLVGFPTPPVTLAWVFNVDRANGPSQIFCGQSIRLTQSPVSATHGQFLGFRFAIG